MKTTENQQNTTLLLPPPNYDEPISGLSEILILIQIANYNQKQLLNQISEEEKI